MKRKPKYSNFLEYIRDNPKHYWFKRKLYGWGWFPATIEGWIVVLAFILVTILNGFYFSYNFEMNNLSYLDWGIFFGVLIFSVIILIIISYKKGEKPKWSWGGF